MAPERSQGPRRADGCGTLFRSRFRHGRMPTPAARRHAPDGAAHRSASGPAGRKGAAVDGKRLPGPTGSSALRAVLAVTSPDFAPG